MNTDKFNEIINTSNLTLTNIDEIKLFFNLLEPLNRLYKLGMNFWEMNIYDNVITFHNNVSKCYYNFIYDDYIQKIRKYFVYHKIEFYYIELKEYRYNKTKEIVFAFKQNS